MSNTAEPPVLTLEPTNQGDPNAPDIFAAMDSFFDGTTPEPKAELKAEPVSEPKAKEQPKEEPKVDAKSESVEELPPAIEDGFAKPETKDEVKDPTTFDEVAFDAQTDLEVKGMEMKAGEKFKALKAELKAAKLAAQDSTPPAELLKRVEEAELKAKEAEGLRERLKEASGASAKLMAENDDSYIKEVKQPYAAIMGRLDKLSEVYEMDPSILRAIVREEDIKVQDEMIKTHLSEFTDVRRQEVFSAIPRVGELLDKHEAAMKNAEAEFGTREAKRIEATERLLQEQKKTVQTITQDKWKRWEATIPGLLDADGRPTDAYTKMKNASLSLDFSESRASDQAYAAFAGTLLPFAQQQIVMLQRRIAEYEKDDKKALAGSPKVGDSLAPSTSEKKDDDFMAAMGKDYTFTS